MSLALLHALARPPGLRVRELGRTAQLALTLTTVSRKRCSMNRIAVWEAMAVRCCSGPTTFRQDTVITRREEEHPEKGLMARHSLSKTDQNDSCTTATSEKFLLPSEQQRYQSDLLLSKIKKCESTTAAYEVYQRHREVMDTRHCLALIGRLGELVNSSTEDRTQLLEEEDFKALCGQLFIQCRRMEVGECLDLLKHLSLLEVPSTSKIIQAVLQMIKNQINDLSLKQLIFLEFLLKKMPLTPLCDALLTAIPILMNNAITPSQISDLTFVDLSKAFTICCQGKVGGTGILLQEMYRRGSVRNTLLAMSLVWTLTRMSSPRLQRKLLTREEQLTREVIMKECLETLAKDTDSLTHQQIESTLSNICNGHTMGDRSCYNESFLHAAASYVCRHSLSFEKAAHTIKKLLKMNYLPDELVRYTVKLILSRPEDVPQSRVGIVPLISAFTATALPKQDLKAALDVVMTHKSLRLDSLEYYRIPLLVVAIDLLSVDYYHPHLMALITSSDTLSMLMSKYSKDDLNQRRLVEVDQALGELLQSPHRVPETFLELGKNLAASQMPTKSNLKAMLSQILEDPKHVISGVVTEGGMYIDHLLVLDPEGVPMKLRSVEEDPVMMNPSITSLDVPTDATKLAILDIGSARAFRPTNTLKGPQRLRQRVLEATGFRVLPLLQPVIFQHLDEEKLLYVKRELREAGVTLS